MRKKYRQIPLYVVGSERSPLGNDDHSRRSKQDDKTGPPCVNKPKYHCEELQECRNKDESARPTCREWFLKAAWIGRSELRWHKSLAGPQARVIKTVTEWRQQAGYQ